MEDGLKKAGVCKPANGIGRLHRSGIDRNPRPWRNPLSYALIAMARIKPTGFPGAECLIDSTDFLNLPNCQSAIIFVGWLHSHHSNLLHKSLSRAGARSRILDSRRTGGAALKMFDPDLCR